MVKEFIMKKNIKYLVTMTTLALAVAASTGCGNKNVEKETTAGAAVIESEVDTENETKDSVVEVETSTEAESESDEYFTEDPISRFGTVESVDPDSMSLVIDTEYDEDVKKANPSGAESESMIYNLTEEVPIIDASTGEPIELKDVQPGSSVLAWSGDTMTLSLPAQVNLQALITNLPADASGPMYMVVKGAEWSKDDKTLTIKDNEGNKWTALDDKVQVVPFRTKQIVKLQDVKAGSRIMVWGSGEENASEGELSKIMLLSSAE